MKATIHTGEVSLPPAQPAGWGRKIWRRLRKTGFGRAKRLATGKRWEDNRQNDRRNSIGTMNIKSNGKSRLMGVRRKNDIVSCGHNQSKAI
jgi:hypothetical protein